MAIVHFGFKTATRQRNKGAKHNYRYITRAGKDPSQKKSDLRLVEHGVYPSWARDNPQLFWEAAEKYEGKNRRLYTEIRLGLPRELTNDQQLALVRAFIINEIGKEKHAYTFAIHEPLAMDGKTNPHAHIIMTERMYDGIERDAEQFFKRANRKHPERGGTAKNPDWNRRDKVVELRESWGDHLNVALERAGHEVRVDTRTLEAQGIERLPEPKLGPAQVSLIKEGILTERAQLVLQSRELRKMEATVAREKEKNKDLKKVVTRQKVAQLSPKRKEYAVAHQKVAASEVLRLVKEEKERFYDKLERNEQIQFSLGGYTRKSDRTIGFHPTNDSWLIERRTTAINQYQQLQDEFRDLKKFEQDLLLAGEVMLALQCNKQWTSKEAILNQEEFSQAIEQGKDRTAMLSLNPSDGRTKEMKSE